MLIRCDHLISVIMSIFNEEEEWLIHAIDSILNQTYTKFEFIIINDNPTRNLNEQIVNRYKNLDNRIIYIKNHENIGLTKSLNIGLEIAKGEYIARMDADDYSFPSRLEKQINYLHQHPNIIATGTWVNYFGNINKKNTEYRCSPEEVRNFLMIFTPMAHPTIMIKKEAFSTFGIRYNEEFRYAQDYELFYQLSKVGDLSNIPEILLNYRTANNQISHQNNSHQKTLAFELRKKIIREIIGNKLVEELNFLRPDKRITSFIRVNIYASTIKKTSPDRYQQLCIIKYILLMSPNNLPCRMVFLLFLLINPFQKIGYSFRYYLKAVSNQLFLNYNSLI